MPNDNNLPTRRPFRLPGANTGPMTRGRQHGTAIIANRSPYLLRAELERGQRTGEYGLATDIRRNSRGVYAVKVRRHRAPAPRWRRPAIIAGVVLGVLAALASLAWWAIVSLLAAIPGGVVGLLGVAGLVLFAVGVNHERIVEVLVRVRVK